jgi:hypothetical protein
VSSTRRGPGVAVSAALVIACSGAHSIDGVPYGAGVP